MMRYSLSIFLILLISAAFTADAGRQAMAQFITQPADGQFELADCVELDRVDGAVLAQLERVKSFLADRKWDEAIETIGQVMENSESKLLGVTENRFVGLGDYCQMLLASLPPEGLKLYRAQVDPVARKWYEQGMADRDTRLLRKVVDQAFASNYGDDALLALGDIALESADYATARWYWERIIPHDPPAGQSLGWPGYPDTELDLSAVRARLILASILEGSSDRAREELNQFARLHAEAHGPLGGRDVKYVDALGALLSESASWPTRPQNFDWPTFAGSPGRNGIYQHKFDVGSVSWRLPLPRIADTNVLGATTNLQSAPGLSSSVDGMVGQADPGTRADTAASLGYHPAIVGDLVLVNTAREILAVRLSTGKPAWGRVTPAIFRDQLDQAAAELILPSNTLGTPRFTLTVFGDKLYAQMGLGVTSLPQGQPSAIQPGYLICLDLSAEGRLLWKITPEQGWAFDGAPVADNNGVYVAMRRIDIRPQAYVACFDTQSGRLRWRQFVCSAETPARGMMLQVTHNLLTLAADTIYFNTNLGAVAAINTDTGRLQWLSLYPRDRQGDIAQLAPHWRRDLNPCVYHQGMVYVAPADSPRIFAFDAYTGQMLWQTGTQTEYALDLLGATDDYLIAGGKKLYWIGLKDDDKGRIKHIWPESNERPGFGRGILAGDCVLWPTREQILVFDLKTAQVRKAIELLPRDATGGNLLVTDRGLLIATGKELIALQSVINPPKEKQREVAIVK